MKVLYFDCFSGASGDMILGALLDLGVALESLRKPLQTLGLEEFELDSERIVKKGVRATQFRVVVKRNAEQPRRHLRQLLDIVAGGDLPESVKQASAETFRRIAQAEAEVHGVDIEQIHFHEVGAIDSIADIVGTHLALHHLAVKRIYASPLNLGSGAVSAAHGVMPVPAPATAHLLKNIPCYGSQVQAELVTPTGAALLSQVVSSFGPMPLLEIEKVGSGCGTHDLPDRANVLRAILGKTADSFPAVEPIAVLEANVDDMTPELLASITAELLAAGARDTFLTPIVGKKGRPGHLITVLCDEARVSDMVLLLFRASTTFGVRMRTQQRVCLDRKWKMAHTPWGPVRVKVGYLDGEPLRHAPEFEDCRRVAEAASVPALRVYEAALAAVAKGELTDA